jgi:hypothetical protein
MNLLKILNIHPPVTPVKEMKSFLPNHRSKEGGRGHAATQGIFPALRMNGNKTLLQ